MMRQLELLAPAKDKTTAIEAIKLGADAVYMGATSHGARHNASNSLEDIAEVIDFAHKFDANVYITLNTIIFDSELDKVERLIGELYSIGVDALIVQDLGILNMDIPPIALHASTQCDIRSIEKAKFLKAAGFTRLVLPRELTFNEIQEYHRAIPDIALEAFVHGALCVSYSGDCRASAILAGRSSNRGECFQVCRFPYNLTDSRNEILIDNRYLLSLKDLNRINHLKEMADAGVSSFKIEGRLKDVNYVKNVVSAYRKGLDNLINDNPVKYTRASSGYSTFDFESDVSLSFNRGFTNYFGVNPRPAEKMCSFASAKWIGNEVGKIEKVINPKKLKVISSVDLNNGDGLVFEDGSGRFHGFRINKIENGVIHLKDNLCRLPRTGDKIFRNRDLNRDKTLATETGRFVKVEFYLRQFTEGISLSAKDEDENRVEIPMFFNVEKARSSQSERHKSVLLKTGNTIFKVDKIADLCPDIFIPASILSELRRQVLDELLELRMMNHRPEKPGQKDELAMKKNLENHPISSHYNVANRLASEIYKNVGAATIDWAIEKKLSEGRNIGLSEPLMTCRYCIRREFNKCLKEPSGKAWPKELYLTPTAKLPDGSAPSLRLEFDCSNCRMKVFMA